MGDALTKEKLILNLKNWLADAINSAEINMQAKKFKNWSSEEFTWKYDGVPHTFPAGMEIFLESPKADHFAKHLVDRELNKLGKPTNSPMREELTVRCFPTEEVISQEQALNINEEVKAKAKKGKPSKKVVEEEFADLNEDEK